MIAVCVAVPVAAVGEGFDQQRRIAELVTQRLPEIAHPGPLTRFTALSKVAMYSRL